MILPLLLELFLSLSVYAQQVSVKGHVKDSTGEPVIGADVAVKDNSSIDAIIGPNGNFALSVPRHSILVISFTDYKPVEVKAAPDVAVTLQDDAVMLQEAVVIDYGAAKKDGVTDLMMAVSTDRMVKGMAISVSDLLVGRVADVGVITDGGALGAGATVRVRGGSSMSANNDPLIIISRVPVDNTEIKGMDNPLSAIHSSNIETFTILKDASATAIYGSHASNGVIIITTKKGQSGRVKVNYSGTFSINTKSNMVDAMKADDFRNFVIGKLSENSPQANALGKTSTDWQDKILRMVFSTDHSISAFGAVPHMPYHVSVMYTNENGILKTPNMQRLTSAISLNPDFFDKKPSIQLNVKGVYNKNRFTDRAVIGPATQYDPAQPIYMEDSPYGNGYFMYIKQEGDGTSPIDIGLANPAAMLEEKDDKSTVYHSIGNAQIDYKFHFLSGLRANLNSGYGVPESKSDAIITGNSPLTYYTGNFKSSFGENSHCTQLGHSTSFDFYLNYINTFGINYIDVMAGYSRQHFCNSATNSYLYSAVYAEEAGEEFYKKGDGYVNENYLVSFFGRLSYTLLNRCLVAFTLRNGGSSCFSPDNHWGLSLSVTPTWKLNEKSSLKNVNAISSLKLRLDYDVTGQQNLGSGDYPYMTRYMYSEADANYYFGDTKCSLTALQPYGQSLKWEETATRSADINYSFLNGCIMGIVDYYFRKTKNLLSTITAPAGINLSNQLLTNVGTSENRDFELSINARAVSTKGWNWNIGYNIFYNRNKITKVTFNDDPNYVGVAHGGIDGDIEYNTLIHRVGEAFNSFHVFEQIYDPDGEPIEGAYVDQNDDNQVNDADLICFKEAAPDMFMGLTSQLSYKDWDFPFASRGSFGNYIYNSVQSNREAYESASMYDQTGFLKNRLASARSIDFKNAQYRSSYYVQNASFVRIDNISLGYMLDKLFSDKRSVRVYATVQDPSAITKYKGLDPEVSDEGVDNNIYPRPRVFTTGLNLDFQICET